MAPETNCMQIYIIRPKIIEIDKVAYIVSQALPFAERKGLVTLQSLSCR